jgi:guanylate kinase
LQTRKSKGLLFIVSAPSGSGKTTICNAIISRIPSLKFSVSYTTRNPRRGEVNDKDYTFINKEEFRLMIEKGEFLEWAEVYGEYYGTSKKRIEDLLKDGFDVLLDIDVQGAMQIKRNYNKGVYIFILPPSLNELRRRLEKRRTDLKGEIEKRMKSAIEEIKNYKYYDYVIINEDINLAIRELEAIIVSQKLKTEMLDVNWLNKTFFK